MTVAFLVRTILVAVGFVILVRRFAREGPESVPGAGATPTQPAAAERSASLATRPDLVQLRRYRRWSFIAFAVAICGVVVSVLFGRRFTIVAERLTWGSFILSMALSVVLGWKEGAAESEAER